MHASLLFPELRNRVRFARALLGLAMLPPALPAQAPAAAVAEGQLELFAARADEKVLIERLRGVRFITSPVELAAPGFPAPGFDVSRVPALQDGEFEAINAAFLDRPASRESLDRLAAGARIFLQMQGRRLTTVYLPPQDITSGYVQVVVAEPRADRGVVVKGARYFSEQSYLDNIRQQADAPIDERLIEEDLAWLNRNLFRRVTVSAAPGREPGTTRLGLVVEERRPWSVSAGYENNGSRSTDEDRVSAAVTWANALGRGDQATYRFIADPNVQHSKTHALNYTAFLPWRHVATFAGSYSRINAIMAAPFSQEGTSWQVSANYDVPLRTLREGWTQSLSFSADFKYSDNTLEFATFPITDNVTHVAQLGATYGVSFRALGGHNSVYLSGYASPGGLSRYNKTSAFEGSRPGAKADYVYSKLSLSHQRPLVRGFSWQTSATAQAASTALLGSEQLNGGGSYAVRGYRESSAFGDWGVVVNNELHAPGFALFKGNDHVDLFAFADVASLNLNVDNESTDLRSAGLGLNYQWRRHLSVRASYGWQLKRLDFSSDRGRAHVSANLSW